MILQLSLQKLIRSLQDDGGVCVRDDDDLFFLLSLLLCVLYQTFWILSFLLYDHAFRGDDVFHGHDVHDVHDVHGDVHDVHGDVLRGYGHDVLLLFFLQQSQFKKVELCCPED